MNWKSIVILWIKHLCWLPCSMWKTLLLSVMSLVFVSQLKIGRIPPILIYLNTSLTASRKFSFSSHTSANLSSFNLILLVIGRRNRVNYIKFLCSQLYKSTLKLCRYCCIGFEEEKKCIKMKIYAIYIMK